LPYNGASNSKSIEVSAPPTPIPWWILALLAGVGGVVAVGGVVWYEEERKRRLLAKVE
jgi:hypothetical protein